jgi:hypothetical protein
LPKCAIIFSAIYRYSNKSPCPIDDGFATRFGSESKVSTKQLQLSGVLLVSNVCICGAGFLREPGNGWFYSDYPARRVSCCVNRCNKLAGYNGIGCPHGFHRRLGNPQNREASVRK